MLIPNEYMTWNEAVKKYPNSWVVFDENCNAAWGGEPLEGIVILYSVTGKDISAELITLRTVIAADGLKKEDLCAS